MHYDVTLQIAKEMGFSECDAETIGGCKHKATKFLILH